jgi:hypothetical protein
MEKPYTVIFKYKGKVRCFVGSKYGIDFKDEEDFNNWYTPKVQKTTTVIACGVPEQERIELRMQKLVRKCLVACLQETMVPKKRGNLGVEFGKICFIEAFSNQDEKSN